MDVVMPGIFALMLDDAEKFYARCPPKFGDKFLPYLVKCFEIVDK
jgi:hypothetical protein